MELFEAIFKRRSVRAYKDEPIKKEEIEKLIESASWAATGANLQPWKFIIITDPEIKESRRESPFLLHQVPPRQRSSLSHCRLSRLKEKQVGSY